MERFKIFVLILLHSHYVTASTGYQRHNSSKNCIGSHSEDGSNIEFAPCGNKTTPLSIPTLLLTDYQTPLQTKLPESISTYRPKSLTKNIDTHSTESPVKISIRRSNSLFPSQMPSIRSAHPSGKLSNKPLERPTYKPSTTPSRRPLRKPSNKPSMGQNRRLTYYPNSIPSLSYTEISDNPSNKSSLRQNIRSTSFPSRTYPSARPTYISGKPSRSRSVSLTMYPLYDRKSQFHTIRPSQLSGNPTKQPSETPTKKAIITTLPTEISHIISTRAHHTERPAIFFGLPSTRFTSSPTLSFSMKVLSNPVEKKYSCARSVGETELLTKFPLKFTYLMEISSNSTDFLLDLENVMIRRLSKSTLKCESFVVDSIHEGFRELEEEISSNFASISSLPIDVLSGSETCDVKNIKSVSCFVVDGALTLETTFTDHLLINRQKVEILKEIVKSMASGEFISEEIPQLISLKYLGPDIVDFIGEGTTSKSSEVDNLSTIDFAYIALGSTIFIAIFAFFTRRRFFSSSEDEIYEEIV